MANAEKAAGGMLDRSRMALCAFTLLFLSFNPLASLMCGSQSRAAEDVSPGHAGTGRTMLAVDNAGTVPSNIQDKFGYPVWPHLFNVLICQAFTKPDMQTPSC